MKEISTKRLRLKKIIRRSADIEGMSDVSICFVRNIPSVLFDMSIPMSADKYRKASVWELSSKVGKFHLLLWNEDSLWAMGADPADKNYQDAVLPIKVLSDPCVKMGQYIKQCFKEK